ncbi:MAG: prepilin peptidase [Nitrospirae bacterium]|nr:prepilin peptidase [Nitrospirota bacterium]
MPREGLSIVSPPSSCPTCGNGIKPWHNIPVISYLALRGRCAYCGAHISLRYPAVELLNALLYVLVYEKFGISAYSIYYMMFMSALIVITFIDIDFQIIPDDITVHGVQIGLICALFVLPEPYSHDKLLGLYGSIAGLLTGWTIFFIIIVASKGGMGGGDLKFMGLVGATLGCKSVLMTLFIGTFTGAFYGIFLMVFMGKGRKAKIPFGPFLAFGAAISLLYGREILRVYFNQLG